MTLSSRAIEAGARAIKELEAKGASTYTDMATVCLAALAAEGMVLVPKEPTEAMLNAGDSMMPQIMPGQDITTGYDALRDAWPAMLSAHQADEDSEGKK